MILVIDNYDSFTYNLVQVLGKFVKEIVVQRNDRVSVGEIQQMKPSGIVISPGPGRPEHAGVTLDTILRCGDRTPILGVCLGHQAIGLAFGGRVVHAPSLMHGRTSSINHERTPLYRGVPAPFVGARYHSLVVSAEEFPDELEVTARTGDGVIMGIRHRSRPIEGVQFHPESIMTEHGERMINNWLEGLPWG